MSGWWHYEQYEKPIDIEKVVVGKEYFYLPGPGKPTGKVKVLSKDPEKGIVVEYTEPEKNGVNQTDLVIKFNDKEKKLYELLSGGKKSSGNRKNKRTKTRKAKRRRKNKRKTNRRR